jgi:glycosyltransferase involved in cell wall biosynthesis
VSHTCFISLIVISLNGEAVLSRCLRSIKALEWEPDRLEVIGINNGSRDGTAAIFEQWEQELPLTTLHLRENAGFAGGNNVGISRARGDWVILLNDDTELHANWLRQLMLALKRASLEALSCIRTAGYSTQVVRSLQTEIHNTSMYTRNWRKASRLHLRKLITLQGQCLRSVERSLIL